MKTREEKIDAIYCEIAETTEIYGPDKQSVLKFKPVMIGDVLDWLESKGQSHTCAITYIMRSWRAKRMPIDSKENLEALDEVYNLIVELGEKPHHI